MGGDVEDALLVHAYLRAMAASRDSEISGPFSILFSESTNSPYFNYAIPDDFAEPTDDELRALEAAFARRARRPRIEFAPSAAPKLEAALLAAGFTVELRPPLMTRGRDAIEQEADHGPFAFSFAEDVADIRACTGIQHEVFDEPPPADGIDVSEARLSLTLGARHLIARCRATGEPAGTGSCMPPQSGVTELVGIAVKPGFRRHGLGQAIADHLARDAFALGRTMVFMSAAGEAQAAIYARAGFTRRMPMTFISRQAGG